MQRALVTGATGLVGSHIVERLLRRRLGRCARSFATPVARRLDVASASSRHGDVLDARRFARAARRVSTSIFHTAAAITPRGGWEAYRRLNVDGTRERDRRGGAHRARGCCS